MRFLLFLLIAVLLGCSRQNLPAGSHALDFNAATWREKESANWNENGATVRQQMLGDLIDRYLVGRSREQIIALLGQPSTKMDPDGNGSNLSYPTGPQRNSYMAIDYEWLIIEFDNSNKYKSSYLASD